VRILKELKIKIPDEFFTFWRSERDLFIDFRNPTDYQASPKKK